MKIVKEISNITGISVRTLHYYDEIGLFKPTEKSDSGYRLYDDKALEQLQQILFFREFEIPLKQIKAIMENPVLDKIHILQMQKKMLAAKRDRIEQLITSIDEIMKGENKMDFTIFNKTEIEENFQSMFDHMPEKIKQIAIDEFGSIEQWKRHYIEVLSSEKMQQMYAKVFEWYGGKEEYISAVKNPISKEVVNSYRIRMDRVLEKLAEKKSYPVNAFEVKELIGEYAFILKQLCQIKQEKEMMLSLAKTYQNDVVKERIDKKYGSKTAEFFTKAIEEFYKKE